MATALPTPGELDELRRHLDEIGPGRAESERRHHRRRRRRRIASIGVVVAVALGGALLGRSLVDLAADAKESPRSSEAANDELTIDGQNLRFTLPSEPTYDQRSIDVDGVPNTMHDWYVETTEIYLQVAQIELPIVDDIPAIELGEATMDVVIGGMARAVGGSVVLSESISVDDTLSARRGEIQTGDGRIFVEMYLRTNDLVFVAGSDYSELRAPEYERLLASVELD